MKLQDDLWTVNFVTYKLGRPVKRFACGSVLLYIIPPANAVVLEMRPPFFRYSSVSSNAIRHTSDFFSSQQNRHIAKLCEPPAFARNYLYNLFFVQSGQMGRREEARHVTMLQCYMLHVTLRLRLTSSLRHPKKTDPLLRLNGNARFCAISCIGLQVCYFIS